MEHGLRFFKATLGIVLWASYLACVPVLATVRDAQVFGPIRVLDTRSGPAVSEVAVPVSGRSIREPWDGAAWYIVNVTVVNPSRDGFVIVVPQNPSAGPSTSVLSFHRGETRAGQIVLPLFSKLRLENGATAHVVVDFVGWVPEWSGITPQLAERIADSRLGIGLSGPLVGAFDVPVNGLGHVPAVASMVWLSVTVTEATGPGWLAVANPGAKAADTSTLNFDGGKSVTVLTWANPGPGGVRMVLGDNVHAQVVVDVVGWSTSLQLEAPVRVLDTRQAGQTGPRGGAFGVGVVGPGRAPVGSTGAWLNVTITGPSQDGFISALSAADGHSGTSAVNFERGQTIANALFAPIDSAGIVQLALSDAVSSDVIVDLVAWSRPVSPAPRRYDLPSDLGFVTDVSGDGSVVVFGSRDNGLVPGDSDGVSDTFVWRPTSPGLQRVPLIGQAKVSADGRWLVGEQVDGSQPAGQQWSVTLVDLHTNLRRVVADRCPLEPRPEISGDGRLTSYVCSQAPGGRSKPLLYDRLLGTSTLSPEAPTEGDYGALESAIAADGDWVATSFFGRDAAGHLRYILQIAQLSTGLHSTVVDDTSGTNAQDARIASGGRWVTWNTSLPVGGDEPTQFRALLRDRLTGTTRLVPSNRPDGTFGERPVGGTGHVNSTSASGFSPDGHYLAYGVNYLGDGNAETGGGGSYSEVLVLDLQRGVHYPVMNDAQGFSLTGVLLPGGVSNRGEVVSERLPGCACNGDNRTSVLLSNPE